MGGDWGQKRVEKRCKLCRHSTNSPDPVAPGKRMRWCYGNKGRVDPSTGLENMQGKVDHYCDKVLSFVLVVM